MLATILIFALQAVLLGVLLIQRRRRRRAELMLKESEERMTFTAASANVGLWQFSRPTDEVWVTEHCRAMFGLSRDVPLTRANFLAAIHPEARSLSLATATVGSPAPFHPGAARFYKERGFAVQ